MNSTKNQTLIEPSKESIKSIKLRIKKISKECRGQPQETLIGRLNQVLIGWVNYYRNHIPRKVSTDIDRYVFERTWIWAKTRHSNKGKKWIKDKYWHEDGQRNWVFKTDDNTLLRMTDIRIVRQSKANTTFSTENKNTGQKED
jgi:RNA-directed DNA polymerase